jgi:hypothetical protein
MYRSEAVSRSRAPPPPSAAAAGGGELDSAAAHGEGGGAGDELGTRVEAEGGGATEMYVRGAWRGRRAATRLVGDSQPGESVCVARNAGRGALETGETLGAPGAWGTPHGCALMRKLDASGGRGRKAAAAGGRCACRRKCAAAERRRGAGPALPRHPRWTGANSVP